MLVNQHLSDMIEGGGDREVFGAENKRHPADFVLWKLAKPGEPSWPSPWGDGRPGWHSECVVMSLDLLGEGFDLHCGGMDLKFPHHENERAQAVALGKRFANHWMHNGFVVDAEGEKMSKSLGNVANLLDLMEHYDPRAYRMLLLQSHYRGPVSVGQDNIDASVNALAGLDSFASRTAGVAAADADADVLTRFRERMDDDLDTPGATALLFDTVRRANAALDADDPVAAGLVAAVHEICTAFGLVLNAGGDVPADDAAKAAALDAARARQGLRNRRFHPRRVAGGRLDCRDHEGGHDPSSLGRCRSTGARHRRHGRHVDVAADLHRSVDERLGCSRLQSITMPDDPDLTLEVGVQPADGDARIGDRSFDGQQRDDGDAETDRDEALGREVVVAAEHDVGLGADSLERTRRHAWRTRRRPASRSSALRRAPSRSTVS